ncbi:hypothetical protein ZWY2020_011344 [Hordeum vulgare]|nr:hypothetical protein ZWY2020_011344 [Hordeum vulgare]
MATSFDRWEKDPFFLAAEEVPFRFLRISSCVPRRMESVYKIWVQERSGGDSALAGEVGAVELRRELHTALSTAKWQWRDDLAAFLSASPPQHQDKVVTIPSAGDIQVGSNPARVRKNISADSSNDSSGSADLISASADIGSSPMAFPNEREGAAEQSSLGPHRAPLLNIVKACGLPSALKPKPAIKYKKGAVRWAHADKHDVEEGLPLTNPQLSQGLDGYSERSMSYLNTCDGVTYIKKLYGWLGALRKKLQRSQYQIRYGRPVQLTVFALAVLIIFVFVFKTIW